MAQEWQPVGRMTTKRATLQIAIAVLVIGSGCRQEEVTHFRVAKRAEATPAPAAEPAGASGALAWTLPAGWTQSGGGGGMRYATLKPSSKGNVEVSVVVLPGPAGGELANVNRWRSQLGLPDLDESAASSSRKLVTTRAGPFAVYDFTTQGSKASRMIAALAVLEGKTWFLKMLGDARAVGAARADFNQLVKGLHVDQNN